MANVLFVLHGMGIHRDRSDEGPAPWHDEIIAALDEIGARYREFADTPFSRQVEIIPITYDEPFRRLLETWNADASRVRATIIEERISHAPPITDWLARVDGRKQEEFFWSHVVDVLLYEFFDTVAKQIRLHVTERIVGALREARDADPQVNVTFLAHSLGTAVLHDSLALLSQVAGTAELRGPGFPFNGVFMLANVSRVLEDDLAGLRAYDSVVCTAPRADAYFRHYWNVRHELDPIPAIRAFAPVGWDGSRFFDRRIRGISHPNVHGFRHHLEAPEVHRDLLAVASGRTAVIPLDGVVPEQPPCAAALAEFRDAAGDLLALIEGQRTPFELIKAAADFLALADDAWEKCREELGG